MISGKVVRMSRSLCFVVLFASLISCAAPKGMVLKSNKVPKLDKSESLLLFTITSNDMTSNSAFKNNTLGLLYIIPSKKPPLRFDVILEKKIEMDVPGNKACLVSLEMPPGNYKMQKLIANGLSFQIDLSEITFTVPNDSTIYLGNINFDYVEHIGTLNGVYKANVSVNDLFDRDLALFKDVYGNALNTLAIHNGFSHLIGRKSFSKVISGFSPL